MTLLQSEWADGGEAMGQHAWWIVHNNRVADPGKAVTNLASLSLHASQ